jgi:CDP-diacylglycerol--glycerol-3-phosphate 3-phosphatidyltransferase
MQNVPWWATSLLHPNVITTGRIFCVAALGVAWWQDLSPWLLFLLFTIGAVTDYVDGLVARRFGLGTPFGKVYDQVADKVLVIVAVIMVTPGLWQMGWSWTLVALGHWLIVIRDAVVSGWRWHYRELPQPAVCWSARVKTLAHMVALGLTLLAFAVEPLYQRWFLDISVTSVAIAVCAALHSGYHYCCHFANQRSAVST